jgi:hypothetical protein
MKVMGKSNNTPHYPNKYHQLVVKPIVLITARKQGSSEARKPKYNLFSAIDEPIFALVYGKSCSCPDNSIIAEKMNEVRWYESLKLESKDI